MIIKSRMNKGAIDEYTEGYWKTSDTQELVCSFEEIFKVETLSGCLFFSYESNCDKYILQLGEDKSLTRPK